MRRITSGRGKATPNTHATTNKDEEPDLYVIAEQYPLEKSADVARKAAAVPDTDMESLSNHQWDPYQHYSTLPPQRQLDAPHAAAAVVNWYEGNIANQPTTSVGPFPVSNYHFDAPYAAAAAVNWYEGNNNTANQLTTSVGQYHSFASAGVGNVAARKEGDDQTKLSAQDEMNYGPFPVSNYHFDAPYTASAAVNWYEGNSSTANQQHTTSVGRYHSFASAGVGTVAAKKEDDQTKPSAQGVMNYGP